MFGPILRGEKCTLRPPRKEEAETYIGWFKDPDVIRYTLQVGPMSIWQEEDFIKRMAEEPNAISWVIEVDGSPVGWTGIGGIHWRNGNDRRDWSDRSNRCDGIDGADGRHGTDRADG